MNVEETLEVSLKTLVFWKITKYRLRRLNFFKKRHLGDNSHVLHYKKRAVFALYLLSHN